MTKKEVLDEIEGLCNAISKCEYELVEGCINHDTDRFNKARWEQDSLMVAANQQLSFLYDYINDNVKE